MGLTDVEVLHLQPDDSSAAVRQRVKGAEGRRLVLVVPQNCPGLDSLVDLKLLAREAVASDKEVALVTRDRVLKELAGTLGFRTFATVKRAEGAKWKSSPAVARASLRVPARERLPGRALSVAAGADAVGVGERVVLSVALVAMLAFAALILIVFGPSATVILEPATYPISTSFTVTAQPDVESVDFVGLRIPARVVEMELVGNYRLATTAVRGEPTAKAKGEVVFTNRAPQATTVLSDTIVTTSAGTTIRFRTTDPVNVPAGVGRRARAPIEALEPGPSGNVPAYSINRVEGPMDRQVNVINVDPTEGGGVSEVRYVTNADKEQLRESSVQQLRAEGYDALAADLTGEEFLPIESVMTFVLSETYDKFPDEVADSLGLHMRALVRGTVIDREDVEAVGWRMLQFEVRDGFQLLSEEAEYRIEEIGDVDYDGTLTLQGRAEGVSWVEVEELEVRAGVRGKSVASAEEYLARHLSLEREPSVRVSPAWWGRVPWLPFRISVVVLSEQGATE
jgi:hypothetical protein